MDSNEMRFRQLYEDNVSSILGYVMRRVRSPDDAADTVADTFLTAWRRIDDAPADPEGRLWLYGIARRKLSNQRRGRRRQGQLADRLRAELATLTISRPIEAADGRLGDLAEALSSMRPGDREVLSLSTWEDLSTLEIARVLGCSENAAKLRLSRARKRLAELLSRTPPLTEFHWTDREVGNDRGGVT